MVRVRVRDRAMDRDRDRIEIRRNETESVTVGSTKTYWRLTKVVGGRGPRYGLTSR